MLTAPVTVVSREVRLLPVMGGVGLVTDPLSLSPGLSTSGVRPARSRSEKLPL